MKLLATASLLASLTVAYAQTPPATATNDVLAGNLLLRDFKPKSTLQLPVHLVERAKFPVIDIHSHINDAGMITRPHPQAKDIVEWMDKRNIKQIVILSGAWGEKLQRVLDEMVKPYPERFVVFTQLDYSRSAEPDFAKSMVTQIRDAVKRGARGLKITKQLGLIARDKDGKLIRVNDPALDPIWSECGRLGIPVAIHVGDPVAFFDPIDANNERYEQLVKRPEYRFSGGDFPSHHTLIEDLEQVFRKHAGTQFVSLHVGNWPENLDYVSDMLRRCPNVVVEFGARSAELGRQPNRTRRFFREFPDRVLFGCDGNTEGIYPTYFRWLETDDDYFNYYGGSPGQGRWMIYGLNLPDDVLEKIYHLNAEAVFQRAKARATKVP